MANYEFIRLRSMTLDNVKYNVSVYRAPSSFMAYWECEGCRADNYFPEEGSTETESLEKCVKQIELHHNAKHVAARQP